MEHLALLLADREERRLREAARGQLLWLTGAQLHHLCGGGAYPVPDWFALFPERDFAPTERAEDIRKKIERRLMKKEGTETSLQLSETNERRNKPSRMYLP